MGTTLVCEDGSAVIVNPGTTPLQGLLELLTEGYGRPFAETNPVIVEAAKDLQVEVWHSCTKDWREANGVEEFDSYWSPEGDGRRSITVAYFDGNIYALGDRADAAEVPA
jgi:hypothetical protein